MVKRMDVQCRLLLGGVAGVAGAVWGWVLGFGVVVVVAIAIGAALPTWVLSRLSVTAVQTGHDGLRRTLDELAAHASPARVPDDGGHLADVYVFVPRHERLERERRTGTGQERMRPTPPRPQRHRDTG